MELPKMRIRSVFPWAALGAATLIAAACSLSGQEGRVYSTPPVVSQDPDTVALPAASHPKMNDPLVPGSATPAVAVAPPPVEPSDAGLASHGDGGVALAVAHPAGTGTGAKPVVAPPPAAECDGKTKICPMQGFMRGQMSGAKTPEQLAAAFSRVAGMSPNGGWSWRAISQKGVELAKAGDAPGAKKQCAACHGAYKEPYKAQFRGRKI